MTATTLTPFEVGQIVVLTHNYGAYRAGMLGRVFERDMGIGEQVCQFVVFFDCPPTMGDEPRPAWEILGMCVAVNDDHPYLKILGIEE